MRIKELYLKHAVQPIIRQQVLNLIEAVPAERAAALFLDTGAIIDFERKLNTLRTKTLVSRETLASSFYDELLHRVPLTFVTEPVLKEVIRHHHANHRNGNPEISHASSHFACLFYSNYCDFQKSHSCTKDVEKIRYDTYWAGTFAFDNHHKKCYDDRISFTDRDLIASAVAARYSGELDAVYIVSPDSHHHRTVEVLSDRRSIRDNLESVLAHRSAHRACDNLQEFKNGSLQFHYNNVYVIDSKGKEHG